MESADELSNESATGSAHNSASLNPSGCLKTNNPVSISTNYIVSINQSSCFNQPISFMLSFYLALPVGGVPELDGVSTNRIVIKVITLPHCFNKSACLNRSGRFKKIILLKYQPIIFVQVSTNDIRSSINQSCYYDVGFLPRTASWPCSRA